MRALFFDGREARVVDQPPPAPSPDSAVVRVDLAGICDTDIELVKGYMGFLGVLGHEFVGTVVDGPGVWRSQRVVGEINFACARSSRRASRSAAPRRACGSQGSRACSRC